MYRNTYVNINLSNLECNIKNILERVKDYKYHFGVVKADSYGHYGYKPVETIINAGINYLAVSSLEEALEIRKYNKDIPILCLGIINEDYINECVDNNITITISNLDYVINMSYNKELKVHLKINTGMNRLGFSKNEELIEAFNILKDKVIIEGIYTHIYNDKSLVDTNKQIDSFINITRGIDLKNIPIVHFGGSSYSINYPKLDFVNGCRLGIVMYGLIDTDLELKTTFSLHSKVIQINNISDGTVGYDGNYKINGNEKIAVVPIGYADGIIRKNSGRTVYINDKEYIIVGNICMDMLFVKVDETVNVGDTVDIIKDINHLKRISKHLDTITYEVICNISKRVPRVYIK